MFFFHVQYVQVARFSYGLLNCKHCGNLCIVVGMYIVGSNCGQIFLVTVDRELVHYAPINTK